MKRWIDAFLLAILACLLLIADVSRASAGGPSTVDLLGYDPAQHRIYAAVHFDDPEAWDHPLLGFWDLDSDEPGRLVHDLDFEEAALAEPGPSQSLDRIEELRARLEPLTPVGTIGLELRERTLSVDRCVGPRDPGLLAPCRQVMVELHWLDQVRQLELTTWGMSDLVGAWEVPTTGHRVVLYTHLGHTHEIGYQQELAVLFEPGEARAEPQGDPGRRAHHQPSGATEIRHF